MYKDNIPSGYHISVGAEGVFYILNDGETYISKLSTDLKEAKSKKQKIMLALMFLLIFGIEILGKQDGQYHNITNNIFLTIKIIYGI